MRNWAQRALSWAGQIFGDSPDDAPTSPGRDATVTARVATLVTESLLSEALCHSGGEPPAAPEDGADSADQNAFGIPLTETRADGERGVVAASAGLAAAGVRSTAFVGHSGVAQARAQLDTAARRRLAFVVQAAGQETDHVDHAGYHAVADTGAALAMARDAQHAADLTLLARRLAEEALLPVVLAVDGDDGERELKLPEPALVRDFVGAANDEVEPVVPAQARVFDGKRRRLPRWFDPDRPGAQGARLPAGARDAAMAGKAAFFDAHAGELLKAAAARYEALTGRSVAPLWSHAMQGARHVVVGQGAIVPVAADAADRCREGGQDAGVLGLTWLRPLATAELRSALQGAVSVTVLERSAAPLGADGPLMREVQSALVGTDVKLMSARYGLGGRLPGIAELEQVFANMGAAASDTLYVGVSTADTTDTGPRRQVLLQEAARLAPALAEQTVPSGTERPPEGGRPDAGALPMAVRHLAGEGAAWLGVARFWG